MRQDSPPLIHGQYAQQLMLVRITKSASSLDVFRKGILFPRLCSPCKSRTHPLSWRYPVATPRQRISESPHTSDNVNRPDSRKHIFWANLFRINKPAESGSKQFKPGVPCESRDSGLFACLLSTFLLSCRYQRSERSRSFLFCIYRYYLQMIENLLQCHFRRQYRYRHSKPPAVPLRAALQPLRTLLIFTAVAD